jgi:hypothetical protein
MLGEVKRMAAVGFIGKARMALARDCSVTTLNRWVREGRFPAPQPIGVQKVGWPADYANLPFTELERLAKAEAEAEAEQTAPRGAVNSP